MLKVGVSTFELSGTPSALRRSKKLWHSPTSNAHSASARPAYVLEPAAAPSGFRGVLSCDSVPEASKKSCAGVGSLGGNSFRSRLGKFAFSNHSRENLKEWLRYAVNACGPVVPDSNEAGCTLACGLESSSIAGGRESEEGLDELLKGSMLFSRPQRLFPPLDALSAAGEALTDAGGDDNNPESLDVGRDDPEEEFETAARMFSKERNIPGGVGWSFLSISRQRLGAGPHGAVEGATISFCFARS